MEWIGLVNDGEGGNKQLFQSPKGRLRFVCFFSSSSRDCRAQREGDDGDKRLSRLSVEIVGFEAILHRPVDDSFFSCAR